MMGNDALFTNIQERRNTGNRKNTALAQISNTRKRKITNNNSNSTNNSAQRLAADQLATQQDSKEILRTPKTFPIESYRPVFIAFLTVRDVTWKCLEKSPDLGS
ncbi:hypothetical protein AVEN_177502-1 [Araneus ventricosus]|uniref:Uncharacterized protein n=1 Tax=Araneus ventricosus TaxID=182803 RepID=A0A4Y2D290_ARAVE|nr:hypothetical protein AVEN_177502-1 [Araneus ventricosus]